MQTSASTRPTNRTLNTKLELQTVYLSDPSEAIRCINLASGRVDRVLIMKYFLVRPMAKVLHEDNLHDFIQMAESVYEHGLPRCDIIHTSPYLKAGFSFETMKDPRILFIGAILYSLKRDHETSETYKWLSNRLDESVEELERIRKEFAREIKGPLRDANIVEAYNAVVRDAHGHLNGVPKTIEEYNLLKQFPLIQIIR